MKYERTNGRKPHKISEILKEIVARVKEEPRTRTEIVKELKLKPEALNSCLDVLVEERILFNNELNGKYNITSVGRYFINDQIATASQIS